MQRTLIIMVKEPRPGRVKTRLGAGIGMVPAAWWFRRQSLGLIRRLRDPRWRIVLAVSPDIEGLHSRIWPVDLMRSAQGRGDLGARMVRQLRAAPPGPVCLIGSDIPGVTRAHIAQAFARLGTQDAVFGPAQDGGFWLIGLPARRRIPHSMFRGVAWSTAQVLHEAIASLPGRRIGFAATLRDVDQPEDLAPPVRGDSA